MLFLLFIADIRIFIPRIQITTCVELTQREMNNQSIELIQKIDKNRSIHSLNQSRMFSHTRVQNQTVGSTGNLTPQ